MNREIILDTGPLIALVNSRDHHHHWARAQWDTIEPPLLACEAVVAEACFLARRLGRGGEEKVLEFVRRGVLDLSFSLADEIDAVVKLAMQYHDVPNHDVPMSFADACLVRMSELHPASPVFTLDRDFTTCRRSRGQRIPLLYPGVSPSSSVSAE